MTLRLPLLARLGYRLARRGAKPYRDELMQGDTVESDAVPGARMKILAFNWATMTAAASLKVRDDRTVVVVVPVHGLRRCNDGT